MVQLPRVSTAARMLSSIPGGDGGGVGGWEVDGDGGNDGGGDDGATTRRLAPSLNG